MSYMRQQQPQQQPNGYANGGTNAIRRFDLDASSRETSDAERSRSRPSHSHGGHGRQAPHPEQVHGVARLDRGNAHRRSRDLEWSQSRSRSRPAARLGGAAGAQVEDVLRNITTQFPYMSSATSCIPIKVALQLRDPSSLGLATEIDAFHSAHSQLQTALKQIVNEHHQGFNSSIGTFHKIHTAIHTSQHRVRTLRQDLLRAKANLNASTHRPELKALAGSSQSYEQMLAVIATIEQLQVVPDELEAQIREKRYLGAVEDLQEALRLIRKPELEGIAALSDLRVRLTNQEQILTDMLVEELHNHLYLKSPYCEERWKAHYAAKSSPNGISATSEDTALHDFLSTYDPSSPLHEQPSRNAEADTFAFIRLLVESLHRMGRLDILADRIEERLPVEFHKLLERTVAEVEQRYPVSTSLRRQTSQQVGDVDSERKVVLEDLLKTLFAKFEAIAEAHRVLHDVTAGVLRQDLASASGQDEDVATLNRSFRELWKLVQSEIRSLLHDYLATSDDINAVGGGSRRGRQEKDALSAGNIFSSAGRDKSRRLFRLADTSTASTDLATEREDLESILRSSVPGLVSASKDAASTSTATTTTSTPLSTNEDRSATGHKLLLPPTVFNISTLLPPSLTFLQDLSTIIPPSLIPGNLTTFLDDFMLNVFHPQLEETLLDACSHILADHDTFQPDPGWAGLAARPVFKGTAGFYKLVEKFCGLLGSGGLPHEMGLSGLVVREMRRYYDRCYEWSRGLLQRVEMSGVGEGGNGGGVRMRLAAELATKGDVCDVVLEILKVADEGGNSGDELAQKEADLLLKLAKRRELDDADLIHDRKALAALCMLQVSMKWLASKCRQLRFISPWAVDTSSSSQKAAGGGKRWTTSLNQQQQHLNGTTPNAPYLPLDAPTAEQFDAVILSFSELSTLVLRTLHIDLRLHLLQGVYKAMDTTYLLNQPYNDPDPNISALAEDLSTYSAQLSTHLLEPQYAFLTSNLSTLVNASLIGLVSSIPAMDSYGNARMTLNVLVLQQTLTNLSPNTATSASTTSSTDLSAAARFYELSSLGPNAVVEQGPNEVYNFAREDLKALVRLCWDEERDAGVLGEREKFVMRLGGWPRRAQSLKGKGSRPRLGGRGETGE